MPQVLIASLPKKSFKGNETELKFQSCLTRGHKTLRPQWGQPSPKNLCIHPISFGRRPGGGVFPRLRAKICRSTQKELDTIIPASMWAFACPTLSFVGGSRMMSFSPSLTDRHRPCSNRPLAWSLCLWLGLAGGIWVAQATIAPPAAVAYTARVDIALDRQPDEAYDTLVRRGEIVARAAAQRSFDQDILVTDVSVIIVARNGGAEAPLLSLQVSRPQWSSRPDPRRWATYYKTSRFLLGLDQAPNLTQTPVPTPVPTNPATVPGTAPPGANPTPVVPGTSQPIVPNASPTPPVPRGGTTNTAPARPANPPVRPEPTPDSPEFVR